VFGNNLWASPEFTLDAAEQTMNLVNGQMIIPS
jgi:hypothetical protein